MYRLAKNRVHAERGENQEVIYREFGETGKKVSALGLGTMRLYKDNEEKSVEVIRAAINQGINFIDVGHTYLGGKAESFVGKAMADYNDTLYILAKSSSLSDPDASAVRKRLENSLKTLGTSKLSFYCMWAVSSEEQYSFIMKHGGPYEGALKAKSEGLIEHIVISCHCDLKTVRRIIQDGAYEGITLSVNIMNNHSLSDTIALASEKGMGVVTMNSVGGGIVSKNIDYFRKVLRIDNEKPIPDLLRFNAELPGVTVALSGMSNTEEVIENVAAFSDTGSILSISESAIKSGLCTACGYCTSLSTCPVDIPIPAYIGAYNCSSFIDDKNERAQADKVFTQLRNFNSVVPESPNCPCIECGNCEQVCTQQLPIRERLRTIYGWAEKYHYNLDEMKRRVSGLIAIAGDGKIGITPAGAEVSKFLEFIDKHLHELKQRLVLLDVDKSRIGMREQDVPICGMEYIKNVSAVIVSHYNLQEKIYNELSGSGVTILKLYEDDYLRWFWQE